MSFAPLVRLWLWISACATAAGWILSALGQLNRVGYAVFFLVFIVFVVCFRQGLDLGSNRKRLGLNRFLRRFRRPLPLCFAVLTLVILIGGACYPPTQYTALNYRLERVLQWLAHEQWWWVHTPNTRLNTRSCGMEWLTAPVLLFSRSDRGLFLLNFIPFLFLPGLIFSVFTRLGVAARVAWQWMWLMPTGYIFILQAGSIANDTLPAVYALAMLDFGARAWSSRRLADLWHSILAAALMIGAKSSNLPLLLPWAVLVFALLPLLRRRLVGTALVVLLSALVSFVPTAIFNARYCGDWTGAKIEPACCLMKDPWVGLYGNTFQLLLNNFAPPVFPMAGWWNQHAESLMPDFLVRAVREHFDCSFFNLPEVPTDDYAGMGFGLSALLGISVLASLLNRGRKPYAPSPRSIPGGICLLVRMSPWLSLAVYCMGTGMVTAARLIAAYYPLLLPLLLAHPAQTAIVRRGWWRAAAGGVLALAFVVLIVSPDRPVWPAQSVLTRAVARYPDQRLFSRALRVYTVYSGRSDALAGVRALLPPGIKAVGFIGTQDDVAISLWRPYGERRVETFLLTDPPALLRQRVEYVVLGGAHLKNENTPLEAWLQKSGAQLVSTTNATLRVGEGLQPWYVVKFLP
jgi:hypothetical protein